MQMIAGQPAPLAQLLARQRPGWSLEQPFYISPEIYEFERAGWLAEQWYVLGHTSEVPEPGSYIVRELLGESLLIVRDSQLALRAFYNVCRHRGSRICDADGHANTFSCPYHAWSYRLDGSLRAAPSLPPGIDAADLGLKPVPVREIGGLILGSLMANAQSLDAVQTELEAGLRYHGIPDARIAARRSYPTRGNWKLVIENFIECYHCYPAHPEYCSVMKHVDVVARESSPAASAWTQTVERWFNEDADPTSPLGTKVLGLSTAPCAATRGPIGGGRKTQSQDGLPVGPLMGQLQRFDGGASGFRLEPFVYLSALNDHAVMFQFLPTGAETTDVLVSWLVSASAADTEIDVERMVWLWDRTTIQDKTIIERNAAGVRSRSYVPGPYSTLETLPVRFVNRYVSELVERCRSVPHQGQVAVR
jgi:phenylpropionate dioxygenase-like ring-hydroxylating dioxygenase large terminal subunit